MNDLLRQMREWSAVMSAPETVARQNRAEQKFREDYAACTRFLLAQPEREVSEWLNKPCKQLHGLRPMRQLNIGLWSDVLAAAKVRWP